MIPTIILYDDAPTSACSHWRARGPFNELARQGKINLIEGTWRDNETVLRKAHIAFFQRPMHDECKHQLYLAKDCGLKLWIDLDDYNHIPIHHPVYDVYKDKYHDGTFSKFMLMADQVTITTEYLKNHYLTYSLNVSVIPNAVNDYWLKPRPLKTKNLVFLRAGSHHEHDIYEYKDEIIKTINKNEWRLKTAGSNPIFLQQEIANYKYAGDYNVHDYFSYILQCQASVFILPLLDNELNRAKSNIGWQEATLSGAATLSPEWFGLDGYSLAYSDKKTFSAGLNRLLTKPELRKELHSKSLKLLKEKYFLSVVNNQRMEIIKNLM